jgi:SAM-dependent methyltransferase
LSKRNEGDKLVAVNPQGKAEMPSQTQTTPSPSQALSTPQSFPETYYACPICKGSIARISPDILACEDCRWQYSVHNGQPDFRLEAANPINASQELDTTEKWQNQLKMFLRQSPFLYRLMVYTIGPTLILGPTSQRFVDELGLNAKVLSVGAGVLRLKGNVTHLDYECYPHLEVVGDAHHLPFPENSFDGVVCETLLEHVLEPEQVIDEMYRVLKPGGKCYIMMPFMYGFHAAPSDYQRFTHKGLLHRTRLFETERLKVVCGPTSSLICVLMEWLALLFSFGSQKLYQVLSLGFMVLLSPLKLLDFVLSHHPEAVRIASVFLFIGKKPEAKSL